MKNICFLFLLFLCIGTSTVAQSTNNTETLKVFLDCRGGADCDLNFFRTKVPYVDYVRDQGLADIHVLVNTISTANGGRKYTMQYIEMDSYSEAPSQEILFDTPPNATIDELRNQFINKFAMGLVPYLINTPASDKIIISTSMTFEENAKEDQEKQAEFDPWNYWVFEAGFDVEANFEAARTQTELRTDLDVTRVTDDLRFGNFIYYRSDNQTFKQDEGDIVRRLKRYGFSSRAVFSIDDHWSAGVRANARHDNFRNIDLSYGAGPAVEFSIFPYQEAIYREFTIAYSTGFDNRRYLEETIYQETEELLFDQSLEVALRLRKPWGSIFTRLQGRAFFHDFSKNSVELNNNINVRIIQGLAVRFRTNFEFINDQLSLPLGEVSLEDLLLSQRQLATNYDFSFSVGINYTFGSIYNNIINTRL